MIGRSATPHRVPAALIAATFLLATPALASADLEATPPSHDLPMVLSATSAIRVIEVQRPTIDDVEVLRVELQNTSSKTIVAYSLGSAERWVTTHRYFSDTAFSPGTTTTQLIPLENLDLEQASGGVGVTGVLFQDGTTNGQATSVYRLRENWMGL